MEEWRSINFRKEHRNGEKMKRESKKRNQKVSLKSIFIIARMEYVRALFDARNLVVCSMFLVFYEMILRELIQMSQNMDKPIQILEPFLAVCSSDAVMIMLPIVFFILISDFPKNEENFFYFISRCGKGNWLIGQFIHSIWVVLTYVGVLVVVTICMAAPLSFAENNWSTVATQYYILFPEEKKTMVNELINGTLYNQTFPYQAFLHSFLLYSLYFMLLSVISLLFYVFQKRIYGLLVNGVLIVAGGISAFCDLKIKWFLPSAHAIVWKHYDSVLKGSECTITGSYIYYLLLIGIGILLISIQVKKWNVIKSG